MNETQKRILILGSLDEFCQLVQMARKRNLYTIVCDVNTKGPAKKLAHQSLDIDVREIDKIADICRIKRVDYIVTSFSDLLFECMVKIADKASLPCYMTPSQLPYYRDKAVMKRTLATLNIPTPKNLLLEEGFDSTALTSLKFPVVTKPLDLYGSRGVFVIDNPSQVRTYFDKVIKNYGVTKLLLEEYNEGLEFNMMTWVLDGEIQVLSIADREKSPAAEDEVPYGSRNVYPSAKMDEVYDDAKDILARYIAKTGQSNGPLSMQFFYSPKEGLQVGEIAGRFFGYEHELLEYCSGLSIEQLLLDSLENPQQLKTALKNHNPFFKTVSAVLYFQAHDGIIAAQTDTLSNFCATHVKKFQLFYNVGEPIAMPGSHPYAARIYVNADSRTEIDDISEQIINELSITDKDGRELLFRNKL